MGHAMAQFTVTITRTTDEVATVQVEAESAEAAETAALDLELDDAAFQFEDRFTETAVHPVETPGAAAVAPARDHASDAATRPWWRRLSLPEPQAGA